jgi:YidC/Oxa1 family membrane protein insertase
MDLLPWVDVGIAVIIFTIIVKTLLYPLSKASLLAQVRMKEVEPEVNKIKAQYSSNKQEQALKIMELYKTKNIKPFAGILLIFIQLPILFALISVFYKIIPEIQPEYLYSFVSVPTVNTLFLGFLDLTQKSLVLAVLVAIAQFFQMHFSPAMRQNKNVPVGNDLASQLQHSMGSQMKYFLPLIAFVSVYWVVPAGFPKAASIIAIYWITSTIFTLFQELYIRKKLIPRA